MFKLCITGLFFCVLLFSKCGNAASEKQTKTDTTKPRPAEQETVKGNFSSQAEIKFSKDSLPAFFKKYPQFKSFESDFNSFYGPRNYAYAWFDSKGLIEQASNLLTQVKDIHDQGISAQAPYEKDFSMLIDSAVTMSNGSMPHLETELLSTAEYMWFAKTAYAGISEKQSLGTEWLVPRKKFSATQLLDSLLRSQPGQIAEPVNRQYGLLRSWLRKYRDIESNGGWPEIKTDRKKIQLGDSVQVMPAIRRKLWLVGDLATPDTTSLVFDQSLQNAVKSYQSRYGLTENGVIDASLIKEMNYPVSKRVEQIVVNMERARWVPVGEDGDYLVVNIPEYRLHIYQSDSLLWSMKVVVGKDATKTVIFSGDMKYIVFSPFWDLPASIVRKEVLPGIQKNKNYLANHNMIISGNSGGLPTVRQKPGGNNSLGLVKFLFPNSHNIYLHDTPSKSLFGEDKRAFSHGCIRLAEPKRLAAYLLRKDTSWTDSRITKSMNAGKETWVTLNPTVPVFIVYFTAFVDRQGRLNFRDDIYKRDGRLAGMLMEKPKI